MRIPTNMELNAVDNPKPAATANFDAACRWLLTELGKLYESEDGPPQATFALGSDGKVYGREDVEDALVPEPLQQFRYVALGYTVTRSTDRKELEQSWAMARQLLHDIKSAEPQGRLVWRTKPVFKRYEPLKQRGWADSQGGCNLYLRLAFTGGFDPSKLKSYADEGQHLTRYDA